MMYIHIEEPKKICSKCGSSQFHTWDESYTNLMETETTHNYWIQCNIYSHRSILSTTKMTMSYKSMQYIQLPKPPEFETF